ncbi:Probable L-asparaginase [Oligella urethralis]|uniref:asparaginase n=1 Tax=Oligella urethralis TaxID=90245 RepID=UPI000E002C8D|nr:asparaginase [Oligella urethralis]SUA64317.1 Probable L-asparaginase [Oligella urethralis]
MSTPLAKVAVGSLGGTISMTPAASSDGIVPTLTAADLIRAIPGVAELAEVHAEALKQVASIHLGIQDLLATLAWAERQVAEGAVGVILTQGTDTLEESAFLLDLLWPHSEPLILMGAMRGAAAVSADGPANLLSSIQVAVSANSRDRGVLVVMNEQIHYARWVQKQHSLSTAAFISEVAQAGTIVEGKALYFAAPPKRMLFDKPSCCSKRVLLWTNHLAEESDFLTQQDSLDPLGERFDGIVFAGVGAGHVSPVIARWISKWANLKAILVCRGTGAGSTAFSTYGYPGGEVELQQHGAIMAGFLSPKKARLLLWVILENDLEPKKAVADYLDSMTY